MENSKLETRVVTVLFKKENAELLAHLQIMPSPDPEVDPDSRWVFNIAQFASQNGIELPSGTPQEYVAESEAERDALAEDLLDAVILGQKKADELRVQVRDAFVSGLPKKKEEAPPVGPVVQESSS